MFLSPGIATEMWEASTTEGTSFLVADFFVGLAKFSLAIFLKFYVLLFMVLHRHGGNEQPQAYT